MNNTHPMPCGHCGKVPHDDVGMWQDGYVHELVTCHDCGRESCTEVSFPAWHKATSQEVMLCPDCSDGSGDETR